MYINIQGRKAMKKSTQSHNNLQIHQFLYHKIDFYRHCLHSFHVHYRHQHFTLYLFCSKAHPVPTRKTSVQQQDRGKKYRRLWKKINSPKTFYDFIHNSSFFCVFGLTNFYCCHRVYQHVHSVTRAVHLILLLHEPSWSHEQTERSAQRAFGSPDPPVRRISPKE